MKKVKNKKSLVMDAKKVKYEEMVDLFEKEDPPTISETLHHLEKDITCIRSCLEKPKQKRVTLNEINQKVDRILEILNSWIT